MITAQSLGKLEHTIEMYLGVMSCPFILPEWFPSSEHGLLLSTYLNNIYSSRPILSKTLSLATQTHVDLSLPPWTPRAFAELAT